MAWRACFAKYTLDSCVRVVTCGRKAGIRNFLIMVQASLQSLAFFDEISGVHGEKAGVLECKLNIYGAQCTGAALCECAIARG